MGQYHLLVNFDKKEFVTPRGLGLPNKQLEHTAVPAGGLDTALYVLMSCSPHRGGGDYSPVDGTRVLGRWVGDTVTVLGDYTEPGDIPGRDDSIAFVWNVCQHYAEMQEAGLDIGHYVNRWAKRRELDERSWADGGRRLADWEKTATPTGAQRARRAEIATGLREVLDRFGVWTNISADVHAVLAANLSE